jgi:hypothetical protein
VYVDVGAQVNNSMERKAYDVLKTSIVAITGQPGYVPLTRPAGSLISASSWGHRP